MTRRRASLNALRLISVAVLVLASAGSGAVGVESPWLTGYQSKVRLLAGTTGTDASSRLLAFVEIAMPEGWKTYWRTPGDAGGLPPEFDWSQSQNLAGARVLYPAPQLMTDKSGNTLGYKGRAIFPVEIEPEDPSRPVALALLLRYGICKDICVPAEVALALDIPAGFSGSAPAEAAAALDRVPRGEGARRPEDPALERVTVDLDGARPRIVLEALFKDGGEGAEIFLEAPDGLYMPLPRRTEDRGGGRLVFEAELGGDVDLAALKGKTITATLAGRSGAFEATFPLQ